jgi:hypothetical protein
VKEDWSIYLYRLTCSFHKLYINFFTITGYMSLLVDGVHGDIIHPVVSAATLCGLLLVNGQFLDNVRY